MLWCLQVLLDARGGSLAENHIRFIFDSVVDAIACVHRHGYVHHDVKPANLVRTRSSNLLLQHKRMDCIVQCLKMCIPCWPIQKLVENVPDVPDDLKLQVLLR